MTIDYYTVMIRENGKLLGRLTPDGTTTRLVIYAAMLSREQATKVAADINKRPMYPGITAKVAKF